MANRSAGLFAALSAEPSPSLQWCRTASADGRLRKALTAVATKACFASIDAAASLARSAGRYLLGRLRGVVAGIPLAATVMAVSMVTAVVATDKFVKPAHIALQ